MILSTAALLAGLGLLAVAADQLVIGAARLAVSLRVSAVVIGALVVGVGTSAPEVLISVLAAAEGAVGIAAGNLVGSNIANVALVAAVAALVAPLTVSSHTLRRQASLSALAVIAFAAALQVGLSRAAGVLLLVSAALAVGWIIRSSEPLAEIPIDETQAPAGTGVRREAIRTAIALVGTGAGAQLVIAGAEGIASATGLDDGFVGLTVVAVGTSLPELVTAVQAARRSQPDLVVGNVLGSNIFNSLLAGGLIGVIAPGRVSDPQIAGPATAAMVAVALLTWLLLATGRKLTRWEAALLLAGYAVLLPLLA